jgi:hypothetical protein
MHSVAVIWKHFDSRHALLFGQHGYGDHVDPDIAFTTIGERYILWQ